jgi:hypothetical protein
MVDALQQPPSIHPSIHPSQSYHTAAHAAATADHFSKQLHKLTGMYQAPRNNGC